ncbi:hypothetical protein TNIN_195831, partial [Trichonephila inaurata madagascariensis]
MCQSAIAVLTVPVRSIRKQEKGFVNVRMGSYLEKDDAL